MSGHGIRASRQPAGRLAARWLAATVQVEDRLRGRIRRGRTLARSGRVQFMDVAPGTVIADVEDGVVYRPTIRVRTYSDDEWIGVIQVLQEQLSALGDLIEGTVDNALLARLASRGLDLFPAANEIDGDCDCGDYAVPCPHAAAVHHILADALQGEPLLLFALRGRPREQLLADLRRSWGDHGAVAQEPPRSHELPEGDWLRSPIPLPPMTFRIAPAARFPGHVELGPLGGDEDLGRTLAPLYSAGAQAARELAVHQTDGPPTRRKRAPPAVPDPEPKAAPPDLSERVVDALATAEGGTRAADLADQLEIPLAAMRRELKDLERIGVVARTGATRGTRWWLG